MNNHQEINVEKDREKYVGGSDLPALLDISTYKTQFQLAQEKAGIVKNEFTGNEYTAYGHVIEPHIRNHVNQDKGYKFVEASIKDDDMGIRSNCDGWDKAMTHLLEVKSYGKKPSYDTYYPQMQLYMWQFGGSKCYLATYKRPEDFFIYDENGKVIITKTEFEVERLKVEEISRNDEYIKELLQSIETFWLRVNHLKENPEMTELEYYSIGNNELTIVMDKLSLAMDGFAELTAQYEAQKKYIEKVKEQVLTNMVEYNVKSLETEDFKITRVDPSTSMTLDKKALEAEHPELVEQYLKESKRKGYVKITQR